MTSQVMLRFHWHTPTTFFFFYNSVATGTPRTPVGLLVRIQPVFALQVANMAAEALRGEWSNEDVVFRFTADTLTICACQDSEVTEVDYTYTVDKGVLICKPKTAGGENRRFKISAPTQGSLTLTDEADPKGTPIDLYQNYNDQDNDADGSLPHDTSGTDLGLDLCVVGKRIG